MKLLKVVASVVTGLVIAAVLAAVPDIAAPAQTEVVPRASARVAASAAAGRTPASPMRVEAATDAATTPTQRAIVVAVRDSAHTAQVPDTAYSVRSINVGADATWATAVLVPTDPGALDPAVALLQRRGTDWQIADLGSFEVGCDLAPAPVLRELRLDCG